MNKIFKKFEALINHSSNNNKKKEQHKNNIVDIFERTLNSDINIMSRIKLIKKQIKFFVTVILSLISLIYLRNLI